MAGHDLTMPGSSDPQYPGWVSDPTRALGPFGPAGFFLLKFAGNSDLPWNVGGGANNLRAMSLVFYLKVGTAPGSGYFIFSFGSFLGGGGGLAVTMNDGKVFASRHQTGTNVDVLSTTDIQDTQVMVALTCPATAGGKFRIYMNGALEDEVTLTENIAAFAGQPDFWWGGIGGFTSSAGFPGIIGRTMFYDGELSAADVAESYAAYKLIYPGLP